MIAKKKELPPEVILDKNAKLFVKGPAAKDGVTTWIKLVNGEVLFEVEG